MVIVSIRKVAIAAQATATAPLAPKSATMGIDAKSTNRSRSQMTMV